MQTPELFTLLPEEYVATPDGMSIDRDGNLTEDEIIELAKVAARVKPDFVKTSTGFGTAGATPEHVALMKRFAGPDVQVKAAGGIRSWAAARAMIEAGATRLGTSSGIKIIEEMRAQGLE